MRELSNLFNGVVLRNSETPVTTTTSETAVTDAALSKLKAGIAVVIVQTADDGDANETYVITIEGREAAETYVVLATITVPRGATGVTGYLANIDQVKHDMRVTLTVGGTTPSCIYQAMVVARTIYEPGGDVV